MDKDIRKKRRKRLEEGRDRKRTKWGKVMMGKEKERREAERTRR